LGPMCGDVVMEVGCRRCKERDWLEFADWGHIFKFWINMVIVDWGPKEDIVQQFAFAGIVLHCLILIVGPWVL